jgi:hypothetical protein
MRAGRTAPAHERSSYAPGRHGVDDRVLWPGYLTRAGGRKPFVAKLQALTGRKLRSDKGRGARTVRLAGKGSIRGGTGPLAERF